MFYKESLSDAFSYLCYSSFASHGGYWDSCVPQLGFLWYARVPPLLWYSFRRTSALSWIIANKPAERRREAAAFIELYEDSIQAIQISSVRRCAKNCIETASNGSALKMYVTLGGVVPRQIGVVWWSCVFFMWGDIKGIKTFFRVLLWGLSVLITFQLWAW